VRLDQLIGAYWQHYQLARLSAGAPHADPDVYAWASEFVDHVVGGSGPRARLEVDPVELMLRLATHAPDDDALTYLALGPIETYLARGRADLRAIEAAARQNERFRTALGRTRLDERRAPADARRFRRFGHRRERVAASRRRPASEGR
jgi:hypothetical protein